MRDLFFTEVGVMQTIQAALYARVSSSRQTNVHTIERQLSALRTMVRGDGCATSAETEYIDDACIDDACAGATTGYSGIGLTARTLPRSAN